MPHRYIARRLKNWFIYRVLHVDDTPHRIALGVAIGIFITWTPSIPFQMILVVALSTLFGANKFVGVPFVWISNPLTLVPVYGPNYLVGCWLLGSKGEGFSALIDATKLSGNIIEVTKAFWGAIWQIFWELWLGSLVVAAILGIVTYVVMRRVIVAYRRYRHRHDPPEADGASSDSQAKPGS